MKNIIFYSMIFLTLMTLCVDNGSPKNKNDAKRKKVYPMSTYNTGIQSAMEAGSYWVARSIIIGSTETNKEKPELTETQKEASDLELARLTTACGILHCCK